MTEWWKSAVVYQIYPFSFNDSNGDGIGDLPGITAKIGYLKKLGITVIWLNPIFESPFVDNGYDISDYRRINPKLGTMQDFTTLLQTAHAAGIRIILDLVVNHSSNQHHWFKQSCLAKKNRYSDFYIWREGKPDGSLPNNWGSTFGGPAWEYVPSREMYYLHLFAKEQPDLNWENPQLREAVYQMMRFWLDKGIDGYRLDVISLISKVPGLPDAPTTFPYSKSYYFGASNGPRLHEYLHEMYEKVFSHYDVMTVGETPNTTAEQAQLFVNHDRHELNMIFQFDHMHLDYGVNGKYSLVRFKVSDLKAVMAKWQSALANDGWNSLYWSNHDQPRAVSRFGDDQEFRTQSAKMLGTLLHMMRGTPFIFEGEELGMRNPTYTSLRDYRDIEAINAADNLLAQGVSQKNVLRILHLKSRDTARSPMAWNASINGGFTSGKPWLKVSSDYKFINAEEQINRTDSVFCYYQKLIRLRETMSVIQQGDLSLVSSDDSAVFAYERQFADERLLVICSMVTEYVSYQLPEAYLAQTTRVVIDNYSRILEPTDKMIELAPYEALVLYFKLKE